MISLEKITQQLQQTKDSNIVLPKISNKYTNKRKKNHSH